MILLSGWYKNHCKNWFCDSHQKWDLDLKCSIIHVCVCILGHAEPQNWFNPWRGVVFNLVLVPFWDSFYIFWHFIWTFLLKNAWLRIKKKEKPTLILGCFGNKHLFILGLILNKIFKAFNKMHCELITDIIIQSNNKKDKQFLPSGLRKLIKMHQLHKSLRDQVFIAR